MSHWSEYLSAAVVHTECMRHAPIQIDIMQLMAAMQEAQRQQAQYQGIISDPRGFDRGLIAGVR